MAFIPFEDTTRAKSTASSPALSPSGPQDSAATAGHQQQSSDKPGEKKIFRLYAPGKFNFQYFCNEGNVAGNAPLEPFLVNTFFFFAGQEEHLEGQETRHEESFEHPILLRGPKPKKSE